MADISCRVEGRAGRITLTRPQALNALSYEMCKVLDAALVAWVRDPAVALIVIDAEGSLAFCSGGDLSELYTEETRGNHAFGQAFWRDEYRMIARLGTYPKPVISLIQGFCLGAGVGVACHGSHRVVSESAQIAMPECSIGLVPDVGGSALLARAPGNLGSYLGLTGARMGPGSAIYAGFADYFIPHSEWPALIAKLCAKGDATVVKGAAVPAPAASLPALQPMIDRHFAVNSLPLLRASLSSEDSTFSRDTLKAIDRASPLALATSLAMQKVLGPSPSLASALELEYRVTHRAHAATDFLEGIRTAVIDKRHTPQWKHKGTPAEVEALLAPLGPATLNLSD